MKPKELTMIDLIVETHKGLKRQGPGSDEATLLALSFIGNIGKTPKVADLGCGIGGQTMLLAQNIPGSIVGVDMFAEFVEILNNDAKKLNLQDRVSGIVGNIETLSFQKDELNAIWCEGVLDKTSFEKNLKYWSVFLKSNAFVVVSAPSWLTNERPAELMDFWTDMGGEIDCADGYIAAMQRAGYGFIASFVLSEDCWTKNYFAPRKKAEQALSEKYAGNELFENFAKTNKREVDLYEKYRKYYGYVFYIGKKC